MKRSIFIPMSAFWFLASGFSPARLDLNQNTLSDLWEKQYNDGELFPASFDPQADPDQDGWSNQLEAAAGTDPGEPNPPDGLLRPVIDIETTVVEGINEQNETILITTQVSTVAWPTLAGKQYTLLFSPDLTQGSWLPVGEPFIAFGDEETFYFDVNDTDKRFWRVAVEDVDRDSDGLTDHEEHLTGTNPTITDTDSDTLSDHAELVAGTDPTHADPDGDGISDPQELVAGTNPNNQDTDGDGIPDSIDNQPLVNAHAFPDADGDGIADTDDAEPGNPRGPPPSVSSETGAGNPVCNLIQDETVSFILTVSNHGGPMPAASDLALFINGTPEASTLTILNDLPPSTRRFRLEWTAKTTAGYPARSLQNLTLRFRDAQQATSWLNVARIDVAEWEGMIAAISGSVMDGSNWILRVASHHNGVRQPPEWLIGASGSCWYRGPKTIPLLNDAGMQTGANAQIASERYPLFVISRPDSQTYLIDHTRDISDPAAYPHDGRVYSNRYTEAMTMAPQGMPSTLIPPGEVVFQPLPTAPETGTPNFGIEGYSVIDGESGTVFSAVWELQDADKWYREYVGFVITTETEDYPGLGILHQRGLCRAAVGGVIIAHGAGSLEHPGLPTSQGTFPPAPHIGKQGSSVLLPIQPEQWHKLVLRVGPDAAAVSNGIGLWLRQGPEDDIAPQAGFTIQLRNPSGELVALDVPPDGKITLSMGSEAYTQLVSPEGLTVFIKRADTVSELHCLSLELLRKNAWYPLESRRIAEMNLLPLEIVSRDKFLAGRMKIPENWNQLELGFGGHEDLGRYGELMQPGSTKVFDSMEDLLDSPESEQPSGQKVWFIRNAEDPTEIRFYTCYNTLGTAEIKLHPNFGGWAQPVSITHELKAAPDFAAIIAYVDQWVKGDLFTTSGLATNWLSFNTTELVGEIANQARACLIPYFDVIDQVTGLTPLAMGLCDGVRTGFADDWNFLQLIGSGVITSAGWVYASADAEIEGWRNEPEKRVAELKTILGDLCSKTVLPQLASLGEELSTWEGFRKAAWRSWKQIWELDQMIRTIPLASLQLVVNGITSWGDDFCTRMMTGEEKTAWDSTPWDNSPLLVEIELTRNRAWYTFGYTFGYLGEQCVTAAISAGTVTLGKIIAKNGTVLISKLAPRAMGVLAIRLHFIKQAFSSINLADDGLRYAYEGMMSSAARTPTTLVNKEIPASFMENRMAAQSFDRATFNFKEWVKTATADGNVRKLIKTPGREGQYLQKASQWMNLMGDKATANACKGWAETYERLLKFEGDDFVEDRADDFFNLMKLETAEGKEAARKSLEDYAAAMANDPNAKLWIKDLNTIQTKGYRYVTQGELDLINANGGSLPTHNGKGWYCSLNNYSSAADAKNALQLPQNASNYVARIEFDLADVSNNVRIPFDAEDANKAVFEPAARSYQGFGSGGGTQILVDGTGMPVTIHPF